MEKERKRSCQKKSKKRTIVYTFSCCNGLEDCFFPLFYLSPNPEKKPPISSNRVQSNFNSKTLPFPIFKFTHASSQKPSPTGFSDPAQRASVARISGNGPWRNSPIAALISDQSNQGRPSFPASSPSSLSASPSSSPSWQRRNAMNPPSSGYRRWPPAKGITFVPERRRLCAPRSASGRTRCAAPMA